MQKNPNSKSKRNQGEYIFELEGPLSGLVAENNHAQQAAGPTAYGAEQAEERFRHTRAGAGCPPFIEAEGQEGDDAPGGEPNEGGLVGDFQAGSLTRFSRIGTN
jgi:hypothetical protein